MVVSGQRDSLLAGWSLSGLECQRNQLVPEDCISHLAWDRWVQGKSSELTSSDVDGEIPGKQS